MTCRYGEKSPAPKCEEEVISNSHDDVGNHCSTVEIVRPEFNRKQALPVSDGRALAERHTTFATEEVHSEAPRGGIPSEMLMPSEAEEAVDEAPVEPQEEDYHDEDGAVHFDQGRVRLPPGVPVPSKEMIRRHRAAGHCPYQSWCEDCIRGACNAPAHKKRQETPIGDIPELHSDYAFFRDQKGDKKNTVTVLVTRDRKTNGLCSHVVPKKGIGGGFAVKQYLRDVKKFGYHHKILIRSDGEPAIRDLLDRVCQLRASETILEASPKGDSKANGRAERAVQAIEKKTRVLKISVERHLGKFSVKHKCFPWLVMHSSDVLNKFSSSSDGLTMYEKLKGRVYSGTMFEFGQCILYKVSAKVQGGDMRPRWEKGMWLGKRFATEEHIISTTEGTVARSVAVKPHPENEYDSQLFDSLVGVPWDPLNKNAGEDRGEEREEQGDLPRVVVPRAVEDDIPQVRRVLITRDLIEKFGTTEGCPKCRAIVNGDPTRTDRGHNAACRTRIEGLLGKDPVLGKKLERAQQRQDEYLARRVEAGDLSSKRQRVQDQGQGEARGGEELQPGPGGASESIGPQPAADDDVDGEPMSRAASTVSYQTDREIPADVPVPDDPDGSDVPIPDVSYPEQSMPSSSASGSKRKADDGEGDGVRDAVDDLDDPEDEAMVGSIGVPKVLMLGESKRKTRSAPTPEPYQYPGKYDLCELFSPARVTSMATKQGLRGGWSLDLNHVDPITGKKWDLSHPSEQETVMKIIRRDKPLVIGLSPECTLFSALQNLRKTDIPKDELARAMACVRFCVEVAEYQMAHRRFFYFEHPLTATSWSMPELGGLRGHADVIDVVLHMCAFGLRAEDREGVGLAKKPTRILTNMPSIAAALDRQCSADHRHVHLISGKAKMAAKYTDEFCSAVVNGIRVYLEYSGMIATCELLGIDVNELEDYSEDSGDLQPCQDQWDDQDIPFEFNDEGWCVDDVRGGELPMDLVRAGRKAEMKGFSERCVYEVRPRSEAEAKNARILGVRWVDTMKGEAVRSRLVCQDFNTDRGHSDEMFAATPPLLASRWLVSLMASQGPKGLGTKRRMALDFSKAFLYGNMKREVYIELPDEDSRKFQGDVVGLLRKSMYGLRDAPQIWQEVVKNMLNARGFKRLVGTQCTYIHKANGMLVVAHVDDFLVLGAKKELQEFLLGLQADGFECSGIILGEEVDDVQVLKFLGRKISMVNGGLEWEGDARHVTSYLDKLKLEFSDTGPLTSCMRAVKTPGVKRTDQDVQEIRVPMNKVQAKAYRGLAALANFMSQDRPDLSFAAKEISKTMSDPAYSDIVPLKRLGRYLTTYSSCAYYYRFQHPPNEVSGYCDSDWGGDLGTRRSTSGGCLLHGDHLVVHWARTQQVISLSSAEAELHALCKCASEGLAARNMSREFDHILPLCLYTDSSAARGIVQRQGAGKVKHLDVKTLWIQERESEGDLSCNKIPRLQNVSDLLTHHWSEAEGELHLTGMSVRRR